MKVSRAPLRGASAGLPIAPLGGASAYSVGALCGGRPKAKHKNFRAAFGKLFSF